MQAQARGFCADQVRSLDPDRYLTALFAADGAREDLFAIYAFNAEIAKIREIVSEPMLGQMRLQWWRDAIGQIHAGEPVEHPLGQALAGAIERHSLPRAAFDDLIDAREFDLLDRPHDTLAQLLAYLSNSSSQVVALAVAVLGGAGEAVLGAGHHIGIAWALSGIIRAVPYHAGQGRLLLPRDLLDGAGVTPGDVMRAAPGPGLRSVVERLASEAAGHLSEARRLAPRPGRRVLPAFLPARLAQMYLKSIAKCGYDPFALGADPRPLRKLTNLLIGSAFSRY